MAEKQDKLDRLFKGYYRSKRMPPPASISSDNFEPGIDIINTSISEGRIQNLAPKKIKEPCPEPPAVSAYIEGVLEDAEKAAIDMHIKRCKKCRDKIESGSLFMNKLKEARLEKTPENLSLDIALKLSDFMSKNRPSKER